MQGFLDLNNQTTSMVVVVLIVVLFITVVVLLFKLLNLEKKWSSLMKGATSDSLEQQLMRQVEAFESTVVRIDQASERLQTLETKMQSAKRYIGLVRYDAFSDVGGSQSFALAVYDERGDGTVITSLVGRTDCRVYAKEIRGGKADRDLSKEESAAIEAAAKRKDTLSTGV